jgi:hypothetical protein
MRFHLAAIVVLLLAGCGSDGSPPAVAQLLAEFPTQAAHVLGEPGGSPLAPRQGAS